MAGSRNGSPPPGVQGCAHNRATGHNRATPINALARAIVVPPRRVNEIVLGKRAITADTALRLARFFGTSEQFWMGLQADYDLEEARKHLGRKIDAIERAAA